MVTDEDTVKRYYAKFEEKFFQTCEKELLKINTFYSEKLAEAQRRFATLQNELQSSLDAQRESSAPAGLRKRKTILKKHDKILDTPRGADWRVAHVEVAPFYTCKKITQLISETEPALAWTTFRVGLYCGIFIVLAIAFVLTGAVIIKDENVWPLVRIHRGGFLLIEFLFLLGINTYGWRHAGVNHVLIFEINPRNNLSHQHLFEIAGFLGVLCILACLYSSWGFILLPMQVYPLVLYGFMLLFLINPLKTCYYKSRFWLLKLLFRDFWLADQLNSLVIVLMDLDGGNKKGLLPSLQRSDRGSETHTHNHYVCHSYSYGVRAIIQCLPAWQKHADADTFFYLLIVFSTVSSLYTLVWDLRMDWGLFDRGAGENTFLREEIVYPHKQKHADADTFFYLLIVFSTVSSLYTLVWDLRMDWGLFDRGAGENTFLREEIVYPHKAYYYCAIIEDVILRFAWTIQISLSTITSTHSTGDIVATVLAPLEFRAVRDISVAPLNADDQTLLEQMMDQDDGVRNRSGKKPRKRSYSLSKKDTKVLIEDTDDEAFS
ncbi:hypothetical protein CRUP_003214 [Coryphaenoides rupestris]|nr:hypothetical protein CRUP_003214 [Coryphaenoides rupestris]